MHACHVMMSRQLLADLQCLGFVQFSLLCLATAIRLACHCTIPAYPGQTRRRLTPTTKRALSYHVGRRSMPRDPKFKCNRLLASLRPGLSSRQRRRRYIDLYWVNVHINALRRTERLRRRREKRDEDTFAQYAGIVAAERVEAELLGAALRWVML